MRRRGSERYASRVRASVVARGIGNGCGACIDDHETEARVSSARACDGWTQCPVVSYHCKTKFAHRNRAETFLAQSVGSMTTRYQRCRIRHRRNEDRFVSCPSAELV